ncbi:MAG: phosphatidate cytidylyltransferase [Planctomycetota bacterium]|nr:phosphatidate cytidylyltransferase [Planctomycetota bacterium]
MSEVNPSLLWSIAVVFAALTGGTFVRIVALRRAKAEVAQSRFDSLRTWWGLAVILSVAVVVGKIGIAILLAIVAAFALKEFISLIGKSSIGKPTEIAVFLSIPLYYALILSGHQVLVREATPVALVLLFGGIRAWLGNTEGYARSTAAIILGLLLFVSCISHVFFLLELPSGSTPPVGEVGWLLFLILMTESNDIMQAITGRRFGKTKMTPRVSPNKSLEGLLGGIVTTMTLAVVAAPWLTTLNTDFSKGGGILISLGCGLMISIMGFLGDINMSAIKRDAGVKDGSRLLPGQGGMIDRIDSLTFTAPAFYYFVRFVMKVNH